MIKPAVLFTALMEVLVLQVAAAYVFLLARRPLPFASSSLGFLAAFAVAGAFRARGGLTLYRVLSHAVGLAAFFLFLYADFRGTSVAALDFSFGAGLDSVSFVLVAIAAAVFWLRGERLGRLPPDHLEIVTRFDKGLGLFLGGFTISALVGYGNDGPARLVVPYFLFGILALGLSRSGKERRGGLERPSARATLATAAGVFMIAAAGVYALMPVLFDPAARAGQAVVGALDAIRPYAEAFLRWLFGAGRAGAAAPAPATNGSAIGPPQELEETGPLARLIASILMWVLGIAAGAVLLALAAYLLAKLFTYLGTRVEGERKAGGGFLPDWLRRAILACARLAARLQEALAERRRKRSPAAAAYKRLLSCGRRAGLPRRGSETPREYAARLAAAFPRSARDAAFVADAAGSELYGGKADRSERGDPASLGVEARETDSLSRRVGDVSNENRIQTGSIRTDRNGDWWKPKPRVGIVPRFIPSGAALPPRSP